MKYILAHDLGTSGDKAALFTLGGELAAEGSAHYEPEYSAGNAVEEYPSDWWGAFCRSTAELLSARSVPASDIACVSFSGQMNCCLPVDKEGRPLRKAMIWADQRAGAEADRLRAAVGAREMYAITGHRMGASYAIAKMMWFKEHERGLYDRTAKFLQAKDYLIFKLTGEMVTDFSDASHLGALDLKRRRWSSEILREAGIDPSLLPEPLPSTAIVGSVSGSAARECALVAGTPVVAGGGDGCCATTGAGVSEVGQAYNVIGTSSWIATLSPAPIIDPEMRTFNFVHLDGERYVGCGTMQSAGLAMQWGIDTLFAGEKEAIAAKGGDLYAELGRRLGATRACADGLYFLPYLMGERSPWWNPDAKGCFIGLTPECGRDEMLRAVLEGVAFNLRMILEIFEGIARIDDMRVIGGGARNRAWLQAFSDVWQRPLLLQRHLEHATSIGAAACGGVAIGAFADFRAAAKMNASSAQIEPDRGSGPMYDRCYQKFQRLYNALEPVAFP
jgi:xylulokinase